MQRRAVIYDCEKINDILYKANKLKWHRRGIHWEAQEDLYWIQIRFNFNPETGEFDAIPEDEKPESQQLIIGQPMNVPYQIPVDRYEEEYQAPPDSFRYEAPPDSSRQMI